ncbi:hypothetical protein BJ508DRAFT_365190 [Ascobolus immersus RN42]|uniref:F-box domain-containing protein n=1 Tax=Ascobolus immersus RN42 TaxID=1160509 RepID=A0A3N4HR84_ASCIM|nr:hypothetical protein BJ508DRAFT_365190 [Ascobolus immersus RN42]
MSNPFAASSASETTSWRFHTASSFETTSSPFFKNLPIEVYLDIGDLLDLFSISRLRATCQAFKELYALHHNERLRQLLIHYVRFQQHFGLKKEHEGPLSRGTAREDWEWQTKFHYKTIGKEDEYTAFYILEDDIVDKKWIDKLLLRIMQRQNPEELRSLLESIGSWNEWKHVMVILREAVAYCQDNKHLDFVRMLGGQYKRLGARHKFFLMNSTVAIPQPQCLELLREMSFWDKEHLSDSKKTKLLQLSHVNLHCLKTVRNPKGVDADKLLRMVEYVVEDIGAQVTATHVDMFLWTLNQWSSDFYNDSKCEPTELVHLTQLVSDILAIFGRKGVDLQAIVAYDRFGGAFPTEDDEFVFEWWCDGFIRKIFGNLGCYLGPFDEGTINSRIHDCISGRIHLDYMELLLKQGCPIDLKNDDRSTPLLYLAQKLMDWISPTHYRQDDSVKHWRDRVLLLPSYWTFSEIKNDYLDNYQYAASIKWFLKNGADSLFVGGYGETPLTLALTFGFEDLISDMVLYDPRREERFGSLSPEEVFNKWLSDDEMWGKILYPGTRQRAELEFQLRGQVFLTENYLDEPVEIMKRLI